MNDNTIQLRIVEMAKRYGLDPTNLNDKQYRRMSLLARESLAEKASAVGSAVASSVRNAIGLGVPKEKAEANEKICRESCPQNKFKILADGEPACDGCGCSGRFLRAKWNDANASCPVGAWTNLTVSAKSISGDFSIAVPGKAGGTNAT